MATKSRNKNGLVLSLVAIVLAVCSLAYCASFAIDLLQDGIGRLELLTEYFGHIIRGGTA